MEKFPFSTKGVSPAVSLTNDFSAADICSTEGSLFSSSSEIWSVITGFCAWSLEIFTSPLKSGMISGKIAQDRHRCIQLPRHSDFEPGQ